MSIHKDNATGKWRVVYRYIDWTGKKEKGGRKEREIGRESACYRSIKWRTSSSRWAILHVPALGCSRRFSFL